MEAQEHLCMGPKGRDTHREVTVYHNQVTAKPRLSLTSFSLQDRPGGGIKGGGKKDYRIEGLGVI